MKILVLGGSYFLGKTFTRLAEGHHELYLLNRGNQPFEEEDIVEYVMDRHDAEAIKTIPEEYFDVIVDFCAYQKGDIETIIKNLKADFKQYIFVSTCDVYRRGTGKVMNEDGELEERYFGGQAGDYIAGKVLLEKELERCCREKKVAFTSIRPAFIYGPDNYAPREPVYFKWILTAGQILHPYDATGEFQMVFVLDVAKAILAACGNPKAYNRAYNLCNPESMTYEDFAILLENVMELSFEKVEISVGEVLEKGISLPFPLTKEESEWYNGSRVEELGIRYTPIEEGMAVTAQYYQS